MFVFRCDVLAYQGMIFFILQTKFVPLRAHLFFQQTPEDRSNDSSSEQQVEEASPVCSNDPERVSEESENVSKSHNSDDVGEISAPTAESKTEVKR